MSSGGLVNETIFKITKNCDYLVKFNIKQNKTEELNNLNESTTCHVYNYPCSYITLFFRLVILCRVWA